MSPFPPPSVPPATAEYTNSVQPPKPGAPPVQSAYRFHRSSDGKTRVDSGTTSMISNPAAGHTILLDHVKKTALVTPTPPPAPQAPAPQMPQASAPAPPGAAPQPPGVHVQDLGKSVFQGHEVEGKRYVIQPPAPPQTPGMPKGPQLPGMPKAPKMAGMPKAPQLPGMPKAPQMPGMPKAPQMPGSPPLPKAPAAPGAPSAPQAPAAPQTPKAPTTVETWTSTKMHLPMLTKMHGPSGQMTQVCHSAVPGEPHPAAFQIPPGYKVIMPKAPALPKAPAAPKF
ncbi:MAG: hypothetical protein WBL61_22990 [Bryobacteraceae bacterium]